jgi:hypothetical protein
MFLRKVGIYLQVLTALKLRTTMTQMDMISHMPVACDLVPVAVCFSVNSPLQLHLQLLLDTIFLRFSRAHMFVLLFKCSVILLSITSDNRM